MKMTPLLRPAETVYIVSDAFCSYAATHHLSGQAVFPGLARISVPVQGIFKVSFFFLFHFDTSTKVSKLVFYPIIALNPGRVKQKEAVVKKAVKKSPVMSGMEAPVDKVV
jgi:hypothetical protein